jgi:hypothetical protein
VSSTSRLLCHGWLGNVLAGSSREGTRLLVRPMLGNEVRCVSCRVTAYPRYCGKSIYNHRWSHVFGPQPQFRRRKGAPIFASNFENTFWNIELPSMSIPTAGHDLVHLVGASIRSNITVLLKWRALMSSQERLKSRVKGSCVEPGTLVRLSWSLFLAHLAPSPRLVSPGKKFPTEKRFECCYAVVWEPVVDVPSLP